MSKHTCKFQKIKKRNMQQFPSKKENPERCFEKKHQSNKTDFDVENISRKSSRNNCSE